MFYCLNFGNDGRIVCNNISAIPSKWGGSGTICASSIDPFAFVGGCLIDADPISMQSSQVTAISQSSSLDEDSEPWEELWSRNGAWSYEGDHEVESMVKALNTTNSERSR